MNSSRFVPKALPLWFGSAALALALAVVVLFSLFPAHSFDMWWHLRTGQLILDEGRIPDTDPFTYTAQGRPWITHEWLAEVLFFGVYQVGGVDLLVLLKALLSGLAVALAAWAGLVGRDGRMGSKLPLAALAVLLAAPLIAPRAFIRPHLLTALFLGATLLLLRLESASGRARFRWALVPVFALWANLHSGFTLGLGLVLLYRVGEWFSAIRLAETTVVHNLSWRQSALAFCAIVLATLLNPHHVEALLYPLRLLAREEVRSSIAELRSVFHPAYRDALFLKVFASSAALLIVLIVAARRRLQWSLLLPTAVFMFLAIGSVRSVSEYAVLLPAVFAAHGAALGERRSIARSIAIVVILLSIAGTGGALLWGQPMGDESNRRVGLGVNPVNRPDVATRFMRDVAPPGRMFNLLGFGGYFIHELWPDRLVYIDGRLDVFPPGRLTFYNQMMSTGSGWTETVREHDLRFAVIDYSEDPLRDRGLRALLREDPAWRCVCFGDNVLIYARDCPENERLLELYGTPFDPSLRTPRSIDAFATEASEADLAQAVTALRNIAAFLPDQMVPSYVLGRMLLRIGQGAEAAVFLRRVSDRPFQVEDTRLLLAEALVKADSLDAARLELTSIIGEHPRNDEALLLSAEVERAAGNLPGAADYLAQVVSISPGNFTAHLRLGIMQAELGDYASARRSFEVARRLRPRDSAPLSNLRMLEQIERDRGTGTQEH